MPNKQESTSIFETKQGHDVRHDIDTVHQRWTRESARRKKRTVAIVLPLAVIIILLYGLMASKFPEMPGHGLFNSQADAQDHAHEQPKENKLPLKEGEYGYPKAKMTIRVFPDNAPQAVMKILLAAVDSKPSEIHLVLLRKEDLTPEQALKAKSKDFLLTINGKTKVTAIQNDHKYKVDLTEPYGIGLTDEGLIYAIMGEHEETYGKQKVPVFIPRGQDGKQLTVDEYREQKEHQIEQQKLRELTTPKPQTFETILDIQPAPRTK